ncbi:unnamed protein product, partial [Prorocentrum cordatum]
PAASSESRRLTTTADPRRPPALWRCPPSAPQRRLWEALRRGVPRRTEGDPESEVELPVSLQLSHWCELTVYSDDPKAGLGPPLVATEPLPEPTEEEEDAAGGGGGAALRAALGAWLAARTDAE